MPPNAETESAVKPYEMLRVFQQTPIPWEAGSAEPWVAETIAALIVANGTRIACEIGGFQGSTSAHMANALARLPWSTSLTVCEIDATRAMFVQRTLDAIQAPLVQRTVVCDNSHHWLPTLPDNSVDFAWVDGSHEKPHVAREIELLWPKLAPGGIAAFHDVFGVCDLQEVVRGAGGYALDLPRLGPAGGIGLLQRP